MNVTKVKESVSYLRGLLDGLDVKSEDRKIYAAITDALSAIGEALCEHAELIEEIDESVVDLYDILDEMDEDLDDDDDDFMKIECPKCGDIVYFDYGMLTENDLLCPSCNEKIDILENIAREDD